MAESRVIYLTSMVLPSTKAHSVQIVHTCSALAVLGMEVKLVVDRVEGAPEKVLALYGVETPLEIVEASRFSLLRECKQGKGIFYTRSETWAERVLKYRGIIKWPVVLETHRKSLYFKNDSETGKTKGEKDRDRLIKLFSTVDGVVCAHGSTYEIIRKMGTKALLLWYGWTFKIDKSDERLNGAHLVYVGIKSELLQLIEMIKGKELPVCLHVFGGRDEDIAKFEGKVGKSHNIIFHGFVPFKDLLGEIHRFKVGISFNEGLKLADYLSAGIAIIAPDLPSIREVLGDNGASYFTFGDRDSLKRQALMLIHNCKERKKLSRISMIRSKRYIWPDKAMKLVDFLREL